MAKASTASADSGASPDLQKYLDIVSSYESEFKKWEERCRKIIKRFRDDTRDQTNNEAAKFNVLWSNVQTLKPAVYAKLPKADVSRRHRDNDPVGRVAALLLERALDFEIEHYPDFRSTMAADVQDRFLGGRGSAWARYEPHVRAQDEPEDGLQITEDADEADGQPADAVPVDPGQLDGQSGDGAPESDVTGAGQVQEQIEYECAPVDYVHWLDFGHSVARTWEEVQQVWRWVYLTKEAAVERFGEEAAAQLAYNATPDPLQKKTEKRKAKLAKVCELWDKATGNAVWFEKEGAQLLDTRPDPLELEGFFPCPPPLYATMTSDTLVPVADFVLYQDQAKELDILTDRIDGLVKALKVRGVYDASVPALQRLFTEGDNNSLIPVDKWMAFSEKGGLKGAIDLVPLDMIAKALVEAYKAHDEIKGQIYEITGISDIIRGQTEASETATAQEIKGQYAGLRLKAYRDEVALFATALIRLKAHIICSKFQPDTILKYADAQQLTKEDQALIPQALQLLQDNPLRTFRVQVAADSLVQIDEEAVKKSRKEFIAAAGEFLSKAAPVAQMAPQALPLLAELLKFGVIAFKEARSIEGVIDGLIDKLNQQAQQQQQQGQQPPPPDPAMVKAQAEVKAIDTRSKLDVARTQAELQADQKRLQMEMEKNQAELAAMGQQAQMAHQQAQARMMTAGQPQ